MTRTWWPSLVLQTTATAVGTRQPSWNWMTLWNTLCKFKQAPERLELRWTEMLSARLGSAGGFPLVHLWDLHSCFGVCEFLTGNRVKPRLPKFSFLVGFSNQLVCCCFFVSWLMTFVFASSSLQFDPAPRRGEPHVTRRTPDYFLWMSNPAPVNHLESPAPCPTPALSFGWKFLNVTVPGRIETNDWLRNQDFKEESLESDPPLQSPFSMLSLMLLGKNKDLWSVCFLFVYYMFWKPDNKITNVDQMCHILILFTCATRKVFLLFFSRPALKPSLPDKNHTLHPFLLQHPFERSRRIHLLQVVQAAAGGHLSKYITVIWLKTKDEWNKMFYWQTSLLCPCCFSISAAVK